jgi:hypothetical protein
MPAYRERLYLCPSQNGQPGWIVPFPAWWDRAGFFKKFGDRQLDTGNPFYVDYGILLTFGEAAAWDEQCRKSYAQDERSRHPEMIEALRRWDDMLKGTSWVIVESFEWESGYD